MIYIYIYDMYMFYCLCVNYLCLYVCINIQKYVRTTTITVVDIMNVI